MLNNLSIVVVLYSLFSSKAMSLGEKIADFDKTEPNQGLNIFGGLYILRYAIESLNPVHFAILNWTATEALRIDPPKASTFMPYCDF